MQNITGYTKVYGIIADPIRHSISPLMHNTAFGALGIDGVYVAFETPEEQFDAGVRGLKALGIQGFNVSMPYKRRIMDYLDEISPAARLAGAVNTVVREGDRYVGYLTDGTGFLQALATEGIDIAGKKLVILGKGGAATAISVQAALDGAAKITIFNRSDASENAELIRKATGCQAEAYSIADTTTCLLYTSVPVCVPDLSDQTGDGRRGGFWVYVYPQSKSGQKLKGLRTGGISGGHAGQRGGASALEIQPAAGEPGGGAPSRIGGSH